MIKAILVDVDNTILDFDACSTWAIEQVCSRHGIQMTDKMIQTFHRINNALWHDLELGKIEKQDIFERRWKCILRELCINFDGELFEKEFVDAIHISHIPTKNAYDMLEYLQTKYDLYVISNAPYNQQMNRLHKADMMKYFKDVFTSERVGCEKPSVKFFQYCLKKIELQAEQCIVLGDSIHADIQGAMESNIKSIWYNPHRVSCKVDIDSMIYDLIEVKGVI